MPREQLEKDLRAAVRKRDGSRCVVCGFGIPGALTVHHRLPVELGGSDLLPNLVLLCSRCHELAHFFGVNRERFSSHSSDLREHFTTTQLRRLRALSTIIANAKRRARENSGRVRGAMSLHEAIERVCTRHGLSSERAALFRRAVETVVRKIPRSVRPAVSYRLVRGDRFITINCTNYLLFRTPAYSDAGKRLHFDAYLMWPKGTRRTRGVEGSFARFNCVNLEFEFEDILRFTASDWAEFKTGCIKAAAAPRSRGWVSNIDPTLPA